MSASALNTPLVPVKGWSQVLSAGQGGSTDIFSSTSFVPGQSERYTRLPQLGGWQNPHNRWNYVSVRDFQSVYSLPRFIYQVWDWEDFPTGYVEISVQRKCFCNKCVYSSGPGFRILAERCLLPFAGISGKNKHPRWQTKQAEVWTSLYHTEEQLSLFQSPRACFNIMLDTYI